MNQTEALDLWKRVKREDDKMRVIGLWATPDGWLVSCLDTRTDRAMALHSEQEWEDRCIDLRRTPLSEWIVTVFLTGTLIFLVGLALSRCVVAA